MNGNAINQASEQVLIKGHQMIGLSQFLNVCFEPAPLSVLFCDPILHLCQFGLDRLALGDQRTIPEIVFVLILCGRGIKLDNVVNLLAKDVLSQLKACPPHGQGYICPIELGNGHLKRGNNLISPDDELVDSLDESRPDFFNPKVRRWSLLSVSRILPITTIDHVPVLCVAVLDLAVKERSAYSRLLFLSK